MKAVRPVIPSNEVGKIAQHVWKGDGRNKGKGGFDLKTYGGPPIMSVLLYVDHRKNKNPDLAKIDIKRS